MKICSICHSQNGDESYYCTMCGNRLADDNEPVPYHPAAYQQPVFQQPVYDPWDHTAEFQAADVAQHKLYAILPYLTGIIGIIIALLGAKDSPFAQFHLRQNLKFVIVEAILVLCAAVLAITVIVPIAAGICLVIVEIIRIIAFFQVCAGKAREPAIIRGLRFLK